MQRLTNFLTKIQKHVHRWWYQPLLGSVAASDMFLIVIPTDGLMISSTLLAPKKWIGMALWTSVGSSLGALAMAAVIEVHGLPFLLYLKPGIDQSSIWIWTDQLMTNWGGWALFAVAISPLMQHPAVAIAALAEMPLLEIFTMVLAGRTLKYLFLSWIASHAPHVLNKLWGIQDELKEVKVKTKNQS